MKKISKLLTLLVLLILFASIQKISDKDLGGNPIRSIFAFDWFEKDPLEKLIRFNRVLYYVKDKYVDPSKIDPKKMLEEALKRLENEIPEVLITDKSPRAKEIRVCNKGMELATETPSLHELAAKISKTLKFIRSNKKTPLSDEELETIAINGVLSNLDPHSTLLSPKDYDQTKISTSGRFGGLGIIITTRKDGQLVIIAPIDDTPAYKAGLKTGDIITKIGDESTMNMPLDDAVKLMRGEKGTTCTLEILREGLTEPKTYKLTRDTIIIKSVESHALNDSVAYVRIKNFQDDTFSSLKEQLANLRTKMRSFKGIVLDLRSDPGGLLNQSISVSDLFLKSGTIVTTVGPNKSFKESEKARESGTEPDYPMAVLVDAGSASASEIVAGALKNNNRAVIIGRQTFGKGSVQRIFDLPENWALKLTVAEFLTPGEVSIQSFGIMPDIRLIPVTVDRDNMNLFRGEKRIREEDLEQHIEKEVPHPEKPAYQVKFLAPKPKEEDQDALPREDTKDEKLAKIKGDLEVNLASEIITSSKFADRELMLKSIGSIVKRTAAAEEEKRDRELALLGIDWSKALSSDNPDCKPPIASLSLNADKPSLQAGQELEIKALIRNESPCSIERLWGIIQSDTQFLADRELIFGRIGPHQTKESSIKVKTPASLSTRILDLKVKFDDESGDIPSSVSGKLLLEELKRPAFAYNYQIIDDGREGSKGNGNGLVEKGETIALQAYIKNIGQGRSSENFATLKNLSGKGIFLTKGRETLGLMEPGSIKKPAFMFTAKDYLEKSEIEFELTVIDTAFRDYLQDKIRLKVFDKTPPAMTVSKNIMTRSADAPIFGSPIKDMPAIASIGQGAVLKTKRSYSGYYSIQFSKDEFGWIRASDTRDTNLSPVGSQVKPAYLMALPPKIVLSTQMPLETESLEIETSGKVQDDSAVKYIYAFVNAKKVFFESFDSGKRLKEAPFKALLPLEEGANDIIFVSKDEKDLLATKILFVTRGASKSISENRLDIYKDTY